MNKTIATIITLGLAAFTAQSALATQKNGRLIQHDAPRDIADQRSGRLVLMRRKIEVDIGRTHFAVIFPAGAARHQAVAEIDEAARGHKGH